MREAKLKFDERKEQRAAMQPPKQAKKAKTAASTTQPMRSATTPAYLRAHPAQVASEEDRRIVSFDSFCHDGHYQHWPLNLPPATALAAAGLRHRGNNEIECSVCEVLIPVESFNFKESALDAHLRVTGEIHDAGPRNRKRSKKAQEQLYDDNDVDDNDGSNSA